METDEKTYYLFEYSNDVLCLSPYYHPTTERIKMTRTSKTNPYHFASQVGKLEVHSSITVVARGHKPGKKLSSRDNGG